MLSGKWSYVQTEQDVVWKAVSLKDLSESELNLEPLMGTRISVGCFGKKEHPVIVREYITHDDGVVYRRISARCIGKNLPMCGSCGRSMIVHVDQE